MKKLLLILVLFASMTASGQSNEFFIKLNSVNDAAKLSQSKIIDKYSCPFIHREMQQTFLLELNTDYDLAEVALALKNVVEYVYLEEVPKYEFFYTPNDLSPLQYNLTQISAEQAWDINSDASGVRIAILDDAIDLTHIDLAANIWTNAGEIPGNGIDDDGNGWIDDVNGWDFGDNDNDPNPPSSFLDHGSHVAGIASAVTDNNTGIAAIGANAKIVPIKIAENITGALTGGFAAIDYAIALDVDVISMSWGGGFPSATYQTLFDIAYAQGIVCIAAAGNSNTSTPMYPASYDYVISVGSTDNTDAKSWFSNYGPTVDVAAPGSDIYSVLTGAPTLYGYKSGTSMATPLVAGLVALMIDANPLATVDEIENCLVTTCDPVVGPFSAQLGGGRVNAFAAMTCITAPTAEFTSDITQVCPNNDVQFFNYSSGPGVTWNWSFPGGSPATSTLQNPIVTYPTNGIYDVTLTVSNGLSSQTITMSNYITVSLPTAIISGLSSIPAGASGSVIVNFTGIAPYSIVIFDGTTTYPITGITNNPYVHYFSPNDTTDYTLTSFSGALCTGNFSGTATINVTPLGSGLCDSLNASMIKYLGTNIDDISSGVEDIEQYGYLVLGRKQITASNSRSYICRMDNCGNVLWENIYDPTIYGIPVAAHMEGNEILVAGYTQNGVSQSKTLLMRLDLDGNVLSTKRIGGTSGATYPRYMVQAANGDLIFGSVTNSPGGFGTNDQSIIRTLSNGTVIWIARLGGFASEFIHDVTEDSFGNIITTGYIRDYSGTLRSGYLTKLDASGNELWTKKYDMGSGQTYLRSTIELNGFYYSTGITNQSTYGGNDGILLKTDLNGNIIWSKNIGGTGNDVIGGIAQINDTICLLGYSESGAVTSEVVLMRYDQSGNLIDYASFGSSNNDIVSGHGKQLKLSSQGDFIGVAYGNNGVLGGNDIMFFKLGDYSDICLPSTVTIASSDIALIGSPFAMSYNNPTWTFTNISIIPEPVISNQGFACADIVYIDSNVCNVNANFSLDPIYCFADSVNFIDLSSPTDTIDVNYWDFGDGTSTGFVPDGDYAHVFPAPGNYDVTLIAMDTLTGCADTITQTITIIANPSIDLPDTLSGCVGDTLVIVANTYCLSNSAIIDWSPDSLIVIENGTSVTVIIQDPGYVYITIDDNGIIITDSVYLAISGACCTSIPIIDNIVGSACEGGSIQVTQASIVTGSATYSWSFLPDGNPITFLGPTPPTVTFNSTGPKLIILSVTDDCGTISDTVEIQIFELPLFNIGSSDTICSSTLVNLGEPEVDNWNYIWSPGTIVSDSLISDPTATVSGGETIIVIVTDPWTGCSFTDSISFLLDSAFVDILMTDTLICGTSSFTIPAIHSAFSDLLWTPSSVIIQYDPNSIEVSLTASTMITATAFSQSGGCQMTDSIFIEYAELPQEVHLDTLVCAELGFAYQPTGDWYSQGIPINTIQLNDQGIYYFEEVHQCGIIDHSIDLSTEFCACEIYVPNSFTPNSHQANNNFGPISVCNFFSYEIQIFNRWGELIFTTKDPFESWDGTYKGVMVQDGVYTWKIVYADTFDEVPRLLNGHVVLLR